MRSERRQAEQALHTALDRLEAAKRAASRMWLGASEAQKREIVEAGAAVTQASETFDRVVAKQQYEQQLTQQKGPQPEAPLRKPRILDRVCAWLLVRQASVEHTQHHLLNRQGPILKVVLLGCHVM